MATPTHETGPPIPEKIPPLQNETKALCHNPAVLVLDEPASGLTVANIIEALPCEIPVIARHNLGGCELPPMLY